MLFGSPILGVADIAIIPKVGVVEPMTKTRFPQFGATSEMINSKCYPQNGAVILYIAIPIINKKNSLVSGPAFVFPSLLG